MCGGKKTKNQNDQDAWPSIRVLRKGKISGAVISLRTFIEVCVKWDCKHEVGFPGEEGSGRPFQGV